MGIALMLRGVLKALGTFFVFIGTVSGLVSLYLIIKPSHPMRFYGSVSAVQYDYDNLRLYSFLNDNRGKLVLMNLSYIVASSRTNPWPGGVGPVFSNDCYFNTADGTHDSFLIDFIDGQSAVFPLRDEYGNCIAYVLFKDDQFLRSCDAHLIQGYCTNYFYRVGNRVRFRGERLDTFVMEPIGDELGYLELIREGLKQFEFSRRIITETLEAEESIYGRDE